jgi:outer membrane receptor protein involved in Fe transport
MAQDDVDEIQADDQLIEEIMVTGSRIQRRGFEDISQPAQVLQAETLDKRGFTSIADALNELPGFGPGISGVTTGSGQNVGQEFLNLFNLGTQRTLTVVNGRRFVPGNPLSPDPIGRNAGSQVDINAFPAAMIERVEVLSIGGAPIYGSDALAGTINIVLKEDFEGIEIKTQWDDYEDFSAPEYNISAVFGSNFSDGRGNVTAAVEYEDQKGAVRNDIPGLRDRADCFGSGGQCIIDGTEGQFNILQGPNGYIPAPSSGLPLPGLGINIFTDPQGNILTFGGNGGLSVFDPGVRVGTSPVFFSGGNGFNSDDDFQEGVVPVERVVFMSTGHFDLKDNVRLFFETNFLNTQASDLLTQNSSAFNTAALNAPGQGAFGININNPFISAVDRQTLIDAGAGSSIWLNGISLNLNPNAGANVLETTTYRTVGGLEGEFDMGDRHFNWDISMNFGRTTQARSIGVVRGDAFFNAVDSISLDAGTLAQLNDPGNQSLLQSTINSQQINVIRNGSVVNVGTDQAQVGDIMCRGFLSPGGPVDQNPGGPTEGISTGNTPTPDAALAGCTPLNLFGLMDPNSNSFETMNYITSHAQSFGEVNQTDFIANFGGDLFELPAGWVQFNLGFERRREYGKLQNGGVLEDGLARALRVSSFPSTEVTSNETFGELVIPVLNEPSTMPFIDRLDFQGAYRRIQARGESDSVSEMLGNALSDSVPTYSAGATLAMFDEQLVVRGNYTRSVRQPSIVELFSPFAAARGLTGDPCDVTNINDAPGTNRQANCVEEALNMGFAGAAIGTLDGVTGLILGPGDNVYTTPSVIASIPLLSGGNTNLNYEIGDSWTAGFTLRPNWLPDLVLRADWIDIKIKDQIVQPGFSFFTETCFDTSLDAPECQNFTRVGQQPATDGSSIGGFDIVSGRTGFGNTGTIELEALQAQIRYGFDMNDWGNVSTNFTFYVPVTYRDSANAALDASGKPVNQEGSTSNVDGPFPTNRSYPLVLTADFLWEWNQWDMFWRSTYTGDISPCFTRVEGDCDDIPDAAKKLGHDLEHDVSIGYNFNDRLRFRAGISNVFDNKSTVEQQALCQAGLLGCGNPYGRSIFARINVRL